MAEPDLDREGLLSLLSSCSVLRRLRCSARALTSLRLRRPSWRIIFSWCSCYSTCCWIHECVLRSCAPVWRRVLVLVVLVPAPCCTIACLALCSINSSPLSSSGSGATRNSARTTALFACHPNQLTYRNSKPKTENRAIVAGVPAKAGDSAARPKTMKRRLATSVHISKRSLALKPLSSVLLWSASL